MFLGGASSHVVVLANVGFFLSTFVFVCCFLNISYCSRVLGWVQITR